MRAAPAPLPVIAAQVTEEQEPSINPDILNLVDIVLPEKVKVSCIFKFYFSFILVEGETKKERQGEEEAIVVPFVK